MLSQMVSGNRQPEILEIGRLGDVLKRKNVLTFLEQASKKHDVPRLSSNYDVLSDAVHPSMGSNAIFWTKMDGSKESPSLYWFLARRAAQFSPAPRAIAESLVWAITTILEDLRRFRAAADDLCLSAKISHLEGLDYFGFLPTPGPYEECPCGSSKAAKFCNHSLLVEI